MKKVCIFTLYGVSGASSKFRIIQYLEPLRDYCDVAHYSFWSDAYNDKYIKAKKKYVLFIAFNYILGIIKRLFQIFFVAPKCNAVFFQKTCIPKFPPVGIKRLKKKGVRVVFDVDDAMYEYRGDNTDEIASLSDTVLCGNFNLLEHYGHFCSECVFVPTVENAALYKKYWRDTFDNKVVGWIGSKATVDNLDLIVDAMNQVAGQHPEVKLTIISDMALDYPEKIKNCRLIKWQPDTYLREMSDMTVGIMPLKDNGVNRGKCGFKLIQYLNMKKPVIASDVGVNKDIVDQNGYIAYSTQEWKEMIEKLLYDRDDYDSRVKNIENGFFSRYSYNAVFEQILSSIEVKKSIRN